MIATLTTPIAVAAIVLAVAGVAKLRSPRAAAQALAGAGFAVRPGPAAMRAIAGGEIALAAGVLLAPGRATSALLAATYASLALVASALARAGTPCGCFGAEDGTPVSRAHVWLSAAIAVVAAAGVAWPPHGLAWLLSRSPATSATLALGIAGAAYALVLAYTELPAAWRAWGAG
jgi:hypothetical protein